MPTTVLRGHMEGVNSIAFCGDNNISSGDLSGQLILWNIETSRQIMRGSIHSNSVLSLGRLLNSEIVT